MEKFFEERIAGCQKRKAELLADSRADEAVFEQVRSNVYGIFQTIWNTRRGNRFFQEKLTEIPLNWHNAAIKAKEFGNAEAELLEMIKLETVGEIRRALEEHV